MTHLKYQWLFVIKKPFHSACLFILIFLFAIFSVISCFLWNIVNSYRALVVIDTGYTISMTRYDGMDISSELQNEIKSIKGVTGINIKTYTLARPINFVNFVSNAAETEEAFDSVQTTDIKLVGNLYVENNITLQTYTTLTEGIFPDELHPGALISSDLANANNLTLGDSITLCCEGAEHTYTMKITGIYQLNASIQEDRISDSGYEVYGNSPYSYIFCDIESFETAEGYEIDRSGIDIYASSLRSLNSVYQELCRRGYDSDPYDLFNVTQEKIDVGTLSAQSITTSAQIISWITNITTVLIVLLLILLWMRNNYKDISILISIGKPRWRIAADYFEICTIIICGALLCAGPFCAAILNIYGENLLQYIMQMLRSSSLVETDALIERAMAETMTFSDYAVAELKLFTYSELAVLCGLSKIFTCKPTVLFRTD